MKKFFVFVLVGIAAWAPSVNAMALRAGQEYTLSRGEVLNDDLYVASGTAVVAGSVARDVVVAGGNVLIDGSVGQGVLAAGGSVNLLGVVHKDVRVLSGNLIVSGTISGDLVAAGGQIHVSRGAVIGGNILAAGGNVTLDGTVGGNVRVTAGVIEINGTVRGNVDLVAGKISLGSNALIHGNLTYRSKTDAMMASGATVYGATHFTPMSTHSFDRTGLRVLAVTLVGGLLVVKLLMFLASGLFFVLVMRRKSHWFVAEASSNIGTRLLHGFLVLVAVPAATVLVALTVVGVPVAALMGLGYVTWLVLASLASPVLLGSLLDKWFAKRQSAQVNVKTVIIGVVGYAVVVIIPFVGALAKLALLLLGLGTLFQAWYRYVWQNR